MCKLIKFSNLQKFGAHHFGAFELNTVLLSQRYSTDCTGYYTSAGSINFSWSLLWSHSEVWSVLNQCCSHEAVCGVIQQRAALASSSFIASIFICVIFHDAILPCGIAGRVLGPIPAANIHMGEGRVHLWMGIQLITGVLCEHLWVCSFAQGYLGSALKMPPLLPAYLLCFFWT